MIYLILPSYNEEKNLVKLFEKISNLKIVKKITVILIDDCSTDNTNKLKFYKYKFKVVYKRHLKNMGLSIALESGFDFVKNLANKKDFIVTMDSDNTHPIKIIPEMLERMKKNNSDIIIASRFLSTSKVNGLSLFRKFLSIFAKYIFSYLFPYKNLKEYTCNFRIYRSYLIKKLMKNKKFFKNEDFNIAAKIILFLTAKNNNLKISEVPFTLSYDYKIGQSKMKLTKTILLTLRLLFLTARR